jgi:hypothetical protein
VNPTFVLQSEEVLPINAVGYAVLVLGVGLAAVWVWYLLR